MASPLTAAIFSIGTELTRGELVNGNAAWLADQLTQLGFECTEHLTVDDDIERIVASLKALSSRHGVVLCTGGLGPTTDDLTTEAVAKALGVPLERHPASLERIAAFFAARGRTMSPSNEKQADFPRGAQVLQNDLGTAPGFGVSLGAARLFFMPGVPREMKHLFEDRILPQIAGLVVRTTHQIHLRTYGLPESTLGDLLKGVEGQFPGVTIGYRASFPEIELKVHARADDHASATSLAERATEEVRRRIGDIEFGGRSDSFPGAVGRTLRERGLTLSVAESCTGGLIGSMLTSVPGSSEFLLLDAVVYANAAKTAVLGVSEEILRAFGAVSEETAVAMVRGALRVTDADLAVAVTGIAGPGGGTDEKPVGTVYVAVATRSGQLHVRNLKLAYGTREWIRTASAYAALRMVQRVALGQDV
jgi:nicotinamide-nucleotide amidase